MPIALLTRVINERRARMIFIVDFVTFERPASSWWPVFGSVLRSSRIFCSFDDKPLDCRPDHQKRKFFTHKIILRNRSTNVRPPFQQIPQPNLIQHPTTMVDLRFGEWHLLHRTNSIYFLIFSPLPHSMRVKKHLNISLIVNHMQLFSCSLATIPKQFAAEYPTSCLIGNLTLCRLIFQFSFSSKSGTVLTIEKKCKGIFNKDFRVQLNLSNWFTKMKPVISGSASVFPAKVTLTSGLNEHHCLIFHHAVTFLMSCSFSWNVSHLE